MQPRSSSDILATAKVRFKRKKPTVSTYWGQTISFSPPSIGNINNSKSSSSVATRTVDHNVDHPFLEHPEFPSESFTFLFEPPMTSEQMKLDDELQQDNSSSREYKDFISDAESNTMLAHLVLRKYYPKYISI